MIQIEYMDGGSYGTYINEYTDFNSLKQTKQKEIICKLLEQVTDGAVLQDIIDRILSFTGEQEDLGYDDGDHIYRYTMNADIEFNKETDIDDEYYNI